MPRPSRRQVHIDRALTNISVAFIQSADAFVAERVFPVVPVQKQSDRYFVYEKEDWFRDEAQKRAPATESAGGGYDIDNTPSYFCEKYAFHKDVTEEDRVNADDPLRPNEDASRFVTQKMLLKREVVWANKFFSPDTWNNEAEGTSSSPGSDEVLQWDQEGSTPIQDVDAAKMSIASKTGFRPNVLVLGADVYSALRNHDDILGRIVFTQRGIVTPDILAQLFDVERVVIGWAVKNSAAKGATEDTDFLLGKHALLAYSAPSPGIMQPTAGYIFSWQGLLGAGAYGNRIVRLSMDQLGIGTERVEGEMAFDVKKVADDLALFFKNVVS